MNSAVHNGHMKAHIYEKLTTIAIVCCFFLKQQQQTYEALVFGNQDQSKFAVNGEKLKAGQTMGLFCWIVTFGQKLVPNISTTKNHLFWKKINFKTQ